MDTLARGCEKGLCVGAPQRVKESDKTTSIALEFSNVKRALPAREPFAGNPRNLPILSLLESADLRICVWRLKVGLHETKWVTEF